MEPRQRADGRSAEPTAATRAGTVTGVTTTRVLEIRHDDDPVDDRVHAHLAAAGYAVETLRPYAGDPLPDVDASVAGAVVHGGPFAVYEEERFPFLRAEHRLIRQCLDRDVALLGICQGAQSIARVLGAPVGPPDHGRHEYGFYEIRPTAEGVDTGFLPGPLVVCQAHFHTFGIPDGGVRLAESDDYPNQAFRVGERVYGLQFHAEQTPTGFRRWSDAPWTDHAAPGAQPPAEQERLMVAHDPAQAAWYAGFLAGLFPPVGA